MIPGMSSRRRFSELSEQEILALAISSEEDDGRIYRSYAEMLREDYPDTARVFDGMAEEEDGHRKALIELHRKRFGEVIPLIRREHVAGYYARRPVWLVENLGIERIREEAEAMMKQHGGKKALRQGGGLSAKQVKKKKATKQFESLAARKSHKQQQQVRRSRAEAVAAASLALENLEKHLVPPLHRSHARISR